LGNVLAVVSDELSPFGGVGGGEAVVVSATDYYAFGQEMPGRTYASDDYRYGMNGQEKDLEIGDGIMTAMFWEYDSRIARRWNLDPISADDKQADYVAFNDNPIQYSDENGDWPELPSLSTAIHTGLDIAGMVPVFGELADGANAIVYVAEGNYTDAAFSVAAMVPLAGGAATAAKYARKAYKAADAAATTGKIVKQAVKHADEVKTTIQTAKKAVIESKVAKRLEKAGCGCAGGGVCFVAGTLVLTSKGYKSIESIIVGDTVWAYNDSLYFKGLQQVSKVFVRTTTQLVHLQVGSQHIYTTPEHPFYINGKWRLAGDLVIGDPLTLFNGNQERLTTTTLTDTTCTVYNFSVTGYHTYYVGSEKVLVHNNDCDLAKRAKEIQDAQSTTVGRNTSTTAVGKITYPDGSVETVVSSNRRRLTKEQQAVLQPGETPLLGQTQKERRVQKTIDKDDKTWHAERVIQRHADAKGGTATIKPSRPACTSCQSAIKRSKHKL
jgi:Pretoxin HINT domain